MYASAAAANEIPRSGVWLVHPATIGGKAIVKALSRGWVRAVGVFGNRRRSGCGHFNRWPAQLSGLSVIVRTDPFWSRSLPNKTLQQTAATGIALPGLEVTEVAAAAELGRSADSE
jgi:hypothetical protein